MCQDKILDFVVLGSRLYVRSHLRGWHRALYRDWAVIKKRGYNKIGSFELVAN